MVPRLEGGAVSRADSTRTDATAAAEPQGDDIQGTVPTNDERGWDGLLGETTRRTFLKTSSVVGIGGHTLGGTASGMEPTMSNVPIPADLPNPALADRVGNFERAGFPSRRAYREIAIQERRTLQQQGPFEPARDVDAVGYLGLDDGTPVDTALAEAAGSGRLDDTLLRFPAGSYRITGGRTNLFVNGAFGIVGPDARFVLDAGVHATLQFIGSRIRVEGITIDQSAPGAVASVLLRAENGTIEWLRVSRVGVVSQRSLQNHPGKPQIQLRLSGRGESYIRIEDYRALGGNNAGAHSWSSRCAPPPGFVASENGAPGIWVGQGASPETTIQLINPELHGWENGIYASRTESSIQVIGGRFINNNNASIRIAGEDSAADGCSIYFNQEEYPVEEMPGPYRPGEIQGINGVRSESKGTQQAATLTNLDIQAYNVRRLDDFGCGGLNGLIRIQGTVGRGVIDNCRLRYRNITDTPAIVVNRPNGSGYYPAPPGPRDIQVRNTEIIGDRLDSAAIDIRGRPNSMVGDSCIRIPGAGPNEIQGARTQNVGYGPNCAESQVPTGPVGAPGSLSELNLSARSGNVSLGSSIPNQRTGAATIVAVIVALILGVLGFVGSGTLTILLAIGIVIFASHVIRS